MRLIVRVTLLLTVLLAIGVVATPASAVVATFKTTGDIAMGDLSPYKYNNEGAEFWVPLGDWDCDQRTLMRFDVSSLGGIPNLRVDSISLKLYSVGAGYFEPALNTAPMSLELHTIKAANRDWQEGTGNGYNFVPNETCFVAKKTGATAGSVVAPWAGSPGLNTAGVDYDPKVLATRALVKSNLQTQGQAVDFQFNGGPTELTGLINTWLADNYSLHRDNPGLLIFDPAWTIGTHRRVGFFASQCTNPPTNPWTGPAGPNVPVSPFPASYQPQLVVTYSQTPEPGTLILLVTGGLVLFAWRNRKRFAEHIGRSIP
jgi:hypothetical protein